MDRIDVTVCNARNPLIGFSLRVLGGFFLVALITFSSVAAQSPRISRASSSLQSRQEALQSIPFDQMTPAKRQKLEKIVNKPSVYRRMPVQLLEADPELFTFLVRNPEVVINMWQLMGATKLQFQRSGEYTFRLNDGAGTSSHVELVYGTPDLHIFYAEGFYDGPLVPRRLRGKCVMVLASGHSEQGEQTYLTSRLDVFLQVEQFGVELLAKTLHPLVGGTVDKNYADTVRFVGQLSRAAAKNRAGIERLTARLSQVDPQVRRQLQKITAGIVERDNKAAKAVTSPSSTSKPLREAQRPSSSSR